ncbi:ATP-binding protein [filamentous cyanobacterium LEGE 07170]|nr:ATP-binding protein [filamentous cyanobacterium LEGE 07170]
MYGEDFIGRHNDVKAIRQRIIDSPNPNCIGIVGAPRIGKSSLIYQTLIYPEGELLKRRIVSLRINLPDIENYVQFLKKVILEIRKNFQEMSFEDESLSKRFQGILSENLPLFELLEEFKIILIRIRKLNWLVVVFIDEFDAARYIFREDERAFNSLRDLAYDPRWKICLVTASRRTLSEILIKSRADISTFHGIFLNHVLQPFSRNDLVAFFSRAKDIGINLSSQEMWTIWNYTKGHPYLISTWAFHIVNLFLSSKKVDLYKAFKRSEMEFINYYNDIIKLIIDIDNEQGFFSLENLINISLGKKEKLTSPEFSLLNRYSLMEQTKNTGYKLFSPHFEKYITDRGRSLFPTMIGLENKEKYTRISNIYNYYLGNSINTKSYHSEGDIMSEGSFNSNEITQTGNIGVGINQGSIDAENIAGAVYNSSSIEIEKKEVLEALETIIKILNSSSLNEEEKEDTTSCIETAKREVEKEIPKKEKIIKNLEWFKETVESLNDSTEAVQGIVSKLKGPCIVLAKALNLSFLIF